VLERRIRKLEELPADEERRKRSWKSFQQMRS